jgi:hypothetical protein
VIGFNAFNAKFVRGAGRVPVTNGAALGCRCADQTQSANAVGPPYRQTFSSEFVDDVERTEFPALDSFSELDNAQIEQIIGTKDQANGGVLQFNVPRRDAVTMNRMKTAPVGPMGVAEAINFQPTGNGKAAITGDGARRHRNATRAASVDLKAKLRRRGLPMSAPGPSRSGDSFHRGPLTRGIADQICSRLFPF